MLEIHGKYTRYVILLGWGVWAEMGDGFSDLSGQNFHSFVLFLKWETSSP